MFTCKASSTVVWSTLLLLDFFLWISLVVDYDLLDQLTTYDCSDKHMLCLS